VDDDTLKNVVPHSVATALVNNVFPVPGGPTINTPFHGRLMPWKYPGIHNSSITASSTAFWPLSTQQCHPYMMVQMYL